MYLHIFIGSIKLNKSENVNNLGSRKYLKKLFSLKINILRTKIYNISMKSFTYLSIKIFLCIILILYNVK